MNYDAEFVLYSGLINLSPNNVSDSLKMIEQVSQDGFVVERAASRIYMGMYH